MVIPLVKFVEALHNVPHDLPRQMLNHTKSPLCFPCHLVRLEVVEKPMSEKWLALRTQVTIEQPSRFAEMNTSVFLAID
jgi:hypothetical protein